MKKSNLLDDAYRHGPDTAWRRIDDESVVLDLRSSAYYSLNETASILWQGLGAGLTPRQVAENLCAEFDARPEAAARDVEAAVRQLLSERLIQTAAG